MSAGYVVKHQGTGFTVNVKRGVVYGRRGKPIGVRNKYGYIEIRQQDGRKHRSLHAHRVVWEAAYGPIPEGFVVHHVNGLKHDNRLSNLLLITQRQNVIEGYKQAAGAAVPITNEERRQINDTWGLITACEWADNLGISESAVHGIRLANLRECSAFARAGKR